MVDAEGGLRIKGEYNKKMKKKNKKRLKKRSLARSIPRCTSTSVQRHAPTGQFGLRHTHLFFC